MSVSTDLLANLLIEEIIFFADTGVIGKFKMATKVAVDTHFGIISDCQSSASNNGGAVISNYPSVKANAKGPVDWSEIERQGIARKAVCLRRDSGVDVIAANN